MQRILIMAYMGTGKTETEKNYKNVIDLDFQDYKYIYDESIRDLPLEQRKGSVNLRKENPNYPNNFIKVALDELNLGKIVISPFIEHVFDAYNSNEFKLKAKDTRVILVCPMRNNFEEYIERFKNRGNSEEFIERRRVEFPSLIDLFEREQEYEKIIIKPGQFLSEALIENGIILQPKS